MRSSFIIKGLIKSALFCFIVGTLVLALINNVPGRSSEILLEYTLGQLQPENNEEVHGWASPETHSEYTSRFWDLVKTANPKYPNYSPKTSPIFDNGRVDDLWRPVEGQKALKSESSNRIVPQIVWEMEAERFLKEEIGRQEIETKTIVLPEGFKWWQKAWKEDPHMLTSEDCEIAPNSITKCVFTEDKSDLEHAHAVVTPRDVFHTKPIHVPEHVLRFYFILESPFHSWISLHRSNDLLASYWRGSDVVTPYGKWVPYDINNTPLLQVRQRDYSKGKTKAVAAFISNCQPWNDRLGYIQRLKKYIDVDVYGSCGEHKCSRFGGDDCFGMLKKDYYFYLSFENSNCRDYITEKFFHNGLTNDLIPIVMGGHPDDYKALAPQGSYIHVEDFPSPKELAERMAFLINHPSEYNKYFAWKDTGEFIASNLMCQICGMVHYADIVPPPNRTQPFRWGVDQAMSDEMCLTKGQWYWGRNNDGSSREQLNGTTSKLDQDQNAMMYQ